MQSTFFYSPEYDYSLGLLSCLHPFEGRKYSIALRLLEQSAGQRVSPRAPEGPVSVEALLRVHDRSYLESLSKADRIASVLEVSLLRWVPAGVLQRRLVEPAKWACEGTLQAVRWALEQKGMALNLGGGFHHAFADRGEGFCFFSDAAIAVADAIAKKLLSCDDEIWLIDLDAHRGNGFEDCLSQQTKLSVFDMYNFQVYPGLHQKDLPFMLPLKNCTDDAAYLEILKTELPRFVEQSPRPALVFYNAGTDVVLGDGVGRLGLSPSAVIERDRFVVDALRALGVPTVVLTSGGYNSESPKLIAQLAQYVLQD
ncbi:histone deacetylase [Simiduia curdlanivorans]|uniref:Histone deacetylase n=1 Tax=Simiduia curdlanivorans TaxID=1492769 RepID=A0ABV8V646_9GAMM|nr:histone deacetylase [Simiduia curdlanivorans]MDN3637368.1 histone deacetylase [Simiduia curdlanivorans]